MRDTVMLIAVGCALAWSGLFAVYRWRFSQRWAQGYCAASAWLRAAMYWCFCLLLGALTGALDLLLRAPLLLPGQGQSAGWWLATLGITGFMVWAYCIYWYRNTLRFGRPLNLLPQLLFGLCWGLASGLLFLAFWQLAAAVSSGWLTWLLAYLMISVWQALWMDLYWDVYVSPEHDTPASIREKVPRTHIPNMTLCLTHFALFQNPWLFVGWQTLALVAASLGMRMPPPWSVAPTPAARQVPGLLGLPRAGGYVGDVEEPLDNPVAGPVEGKPRQ